MGRSEEETAELTNMMIMVERARDIRAYKYYDNGGENRGQQSPQIL
jgi:hypothetical protein